MAAIDVFGVPIMAATAEQATHSIRMAARRGRVRVAYVNAHTLNLAYEDQDLHEALANYDFVLNDGIGVSLAARAQGRRFPENLNGSDFTPRLLKLSAEEGWRVFLLGGRPGVAQTAAAELAGAIPGLQIVGARHGFHENPLLDAQAVRRSGAEVLLVAMGNPQQELWLHDHFHELPQVRVGVGVGAFLDFQAKAVSRAPGWMNRLGVEWVYRLAREPRRLAKRYLLGNPRFLLRVAREPWVARGPWLAPSPHLAGAPRASGEALGGDGPLRRVLPAGSHEAVGPHEI